MGRLVIVRRGVSVGRVVAAADVTAGETDPKVQPLAAGTEAVFAALDGRGQLADRDLVEVRAELTHRTATALVARYSWTNWTAIDPSPTAAAQRLVEPQRTSPAANMPGTLVSRRWSAPARFSGEDEAVRRASDDTAEPLRARLRAEEAEEERQREPLAILERHGFEVPVGSVELTDLAAVPDGDAVALELVDQIVRHRLAQVGSTVQQRDESATAGEPDGRLAGGVSAADHDRRAMRRKAVPPADRRRSKTLTPS